MTNPDKDDGASDKLPHEPLLDVNIEMTCGKDGDNQTKLWDDLFKALEPFGNKQEQFAVLIGAAWRHFDPFMDEEVRFTDADLISLAKENDGQNNAYTDLQEIMQAFENALGEGGEGKSLF